MRLHPLRLLGLIAFAAVSRLHAQASSPPTSPQATAEHYLDQFIDRSVSPRDDFFHFAVGKWLREHPIPKSEVWWGVGDVIQEETYERLRAISEEAGAAHPMPGSNEQKIGDFWAAARDTAAVDREGFAALDSEFARIAAVKDLPALASAVARLQHIGVGALYGLYIEQDEKHSDRFAVHVGQGGLSLPDRDYYFDTDARTTMLRREYVAHVARMFRLLGEDSITATSHATTVMTIETELAGASRRLEDLNDPIKNYNAMGLEALGKLTPSLHWRDHLADAGITGVDSVIVGQPEFFQRSNDLCARTASTTGRPICAGISRTPLRPTREAASMPSTSTSTEPSCSGGRSSAHDGSARWIRKRATSETRWVSFTSRNTSHPPPGSATPSSRLRSSPHSRDRIRHLTWMSPANQGSRAQEAGRRHQEGRLSRPVEGLLGLRGRSPLVSRQRAARQHLAELTMRSRSSTARWIAPSGT